MHACWFIMHDHQGNDGTRPPLRARPLHWSTSCQAAMLPPLSTPFALPVATEKGSRTHPCCMTCESISYFHMKRNENFKVSPMPASIVPVARKGCRSFADFATTALQVCTTHTTHNQPPTEITHHEGKRHDTRHQVPCSIGGKVSPSFFVYAKFL